jgi:hypothetical protein
MKMNENEFWIKFWKTLMAGLVAVIVSIGGCDTIQTNEKLSAIKEMTKNGAHPIDARCASSYVHGMCDIRAAIK